MQYNSPCNEHNGESGALIAGLPAKVPIGTPKIDINVRYTFSESGIRNVDQSVNLWIKLQFICLFN